MTAGRTVAVEFAKFDHYQRVVGKLFVDRRDVRLEQLRLGYARHALEWAHEQTEADCEEFAVEEAEARENSVGMLP